MSAIPPITGSPGSATEAVPLSVSNTGGKVVSLTPYILDFTGTISEVSWISFRYAGATPAKFLVKPNETVNFDMVFDWPNAPVGNVSVNISFKKDLITSGWYLKYKEAVQLQ
jgi:hypothetical protein